MLEGSKSELKVVPAFYVGEAARVSEVVPAFYVGGAARVSEVVPAFYVGGQQE